MLRPSDFKCFPYDIPQTYRDTNTGKECSDPILIFTDNGIVLVGWYESDGYFYDPEQTYGFKNVQYWCPINFPREWNYDDTVYGYRGEPMPVPYRVGGKSED